MSQIWLDSLRRISDWSSTPNAHSYLSSMFDACQIVLVFVAAVSPAGFAFPSLSKDTLRRLELRKATLVDGTRELESLQAPRASGYAVWLWSLTSLVEGTRLTAKNLSRLFVEGTDLGQVRFCNISTSAVGFEGGCTRLKKGEEMDMCGRVSFATFPWRSRARDLTDSILPSLLASSLVPSSSILLEGFVSRVVLDEDAFFIG